jgi:hypothetical protein
MSLGSRSEQKDGTRNAFPALLSAVKSMDGEVNVATGVPVLKLASA